MNKRIFLKFDNVCKSFGSVKALDKVSFDVIEGEVHCLLGENGAGKSTLIKVLAGSYIIDGGTIYINDVPVSIVSPKDGAEHGIAVVYQELSTIAHISVADTIILGRENKKLGINLVRQNEIYAQKYLDMINLDVSPSAKMYTLSTAQRQMVMIAKALSQDAKLIVFDEPTSFLSGKETDSLFKIIKQLSSSGISIIYISHRLEEINQIGDRISILKDGKYEGTWRVGELSMSQIVNKMVGRDMADMYPARNEQIGDVVLRVEHLNNSKIHDISFQVRCGEILGLSGLVGAGRSEVLRAIFGADRIVSGNIYIDGNKAVINSPGDAIKYHIGMVPEDRRQLGIIGPLSIKDNIIVILSGFKSRFGFLDRKGENDIVDSFIEKLKIKTPTRYQQMGKLSGGNQQKGILARWLCVKPRILLLDEPTQGIDVGAKADIYKLMTELAKSGIAIVMVSSELVEVVNVCNRVLVMKDGYISGEVTGSSITESNISMLAMGVNKNE